AGEDCRSLHELSVRRRGARTRVLGVPGLRADRLQERWGGHTRHTESVGSPLQPGGPGQADEPTQVPSSVAAEPTQDNSPLTGRPGRERVAGKVALVFGAGSSGPGWGNGKAAAMAYAHEGAKVAVVDIRLEAAI